MNRFVFLSIIIFGCLNLFSQEQVSIHEQQLEYYNALGHDAVWYEENVNTEVYEVSSDRSGCTPDKVVYGWHPYWVGSAYNNYDWDLLTHFSYFSYEVNPANGEALSTHSWATSAAVDAALAAGVKVTLCVTLFGGSDLATFLTNSTAKQTLIDNLIDLVQSRGAHGVNIDFEGLPASQKTNFANFMVDLCNQMHTAIPGSEVSTVLYAVDWSDVFDFSIMEPEVDHYIVMGYAYYYQGSSTTGPCDPLYHFGSSYNYTLSKTTTYYLDKGCPANKLVMGLPYYGYEWPTADLTIPSSTTGSGVARTYSYVMNNSSGNYSSANHTWDADSYTDIYAFNSSGNKQCFITLEDGFRKRLQHIRTSGIAGIGIWALGYDNGYSELWNGIADFMTECYEDSCSGSIHDFGGPTKNYYNDEDYTWTVSPPGASAINIDFTSFNVELNYDYLYIYDGPSIASPLIGVYTGTNSPGSFTTTSGAVTFRFTSDGATVAPGFNATYACGSDVVPPVTSVNVSGMWQTADFSSNFSDSDDNSLQENFYSVNDYDGVEWRANPDHGFFFDGFAGTTIHPDWTAQTGTWINNSGTLLQNDEGVNNSNIYASLSQDDQHAYLYHWQGQINGVGTNRRSGIHFFCSDPSLDQRGDSYMVFWRADQNKCQIYKSTGNSIVLMTDDDAVVDPNITYDFKIYFDPATGEIKAFLDNVLVSEWTDPSPFVSGNSISPRTGNALGSFDNFTVYKSRTSTENVTIGNSSAEIRYQNINPTTPAGKVISINIDEANNFSASDEILLNIDWTAPSLPAYLNDGLAGDDDVFNTPTEISANWAVASDQHSDILYYEYCVGTTAGSDDVVAWTNNGTSTSFTQSGLSLIIDQTYFTSVRITNGAGLISADISSDGQTLETGSISPTANFIAPADPVICSGSSILFSNNSSNATNYFWEFESGIPATSTEINPAVTYTSSGSFEVTLHAISGTDTSTFIDFITVNIAQSPQALFVSNSPVIWPNNQVFFTNNSTNASSYYWDFGNGSTSTDSNPWTAYSSVGVYDVMLIAENDLCPSDTLNAVVEIIDVTRIEEDELTVTVYPNPFNDQLNIRISASGSFEFVLSDMNGKIIHRGYINENASLNFSDLSPGNYLLDIYSEDGIIRNHLIKLK